MQNASTADPNQKPRRTILLIGAYVHVKGISGSVGKRSSAEEWETVMSEKQEASETFEQIANRICRHYLDSERVSVTQFCDIEAAIVSALRGERGRCWREVTAKADEWRQQARQPGAKRNTLNQMAHGAAIAANVLREGK